MKPHWKVTFRMSGIYHLMVGGKWNEHVRVYRWKWRAKLAAFCWTAPRVMASGLLTDAKVEEYWPNSNVIPLRKAA